LGEMAAALPPQNKEGPPVEFEIITRADRVKFAKINALVLTIPLGVNTFCGCCAFAGVTGK